MYGGGLVTESCPTLATPSTASQQIALSVEFSRQEYWSGLPFPPPGGLPDPGHWREVASFAGRFLTNRVTQEAGYVYTYSLFTSLYGRN